MDNGYGFAFNVKVNKDHFNFANPCGITEFSVVSDDFVKDVNFDEVMEKVKDNFSVVFDTNFKEASRKWLESN